MESSNQINKDGLYTRGVGPRHAIEDEDFLDRKTTRPK